MTFSVIAFLAPAISIVSIYAAQKSYIAITKLREYEEPSERAAKHSETAARQLYKTRVTQGTSAGAVAFSLISSVTLSVWSFSALFPLSTRSLMLPTLNVVAITAAFLHNRSFWKAKVKVPLVQGFNEGIQKSKEIRDTMILLGCAWTVLALLCCFQDL